MSDELLRSWSVYNERQNIQIDSLTHEQAWKIVAGSDLKTRQYWLMWHEGLTSWRAPSDFEGAEDSIRGAMKSAYTYPAVPSLEDRRRAEEEREISVFDFQDPAIAIEFDHSKAEDNRQHRRFRQRYRIEVEQDGQMFTTHTVDISLGGMRLEDALPVSFASSFNARLVPENGSEMSLKCALADPYDSNRGRIRFILTEAKTEALRTMLLENPISEET